MQQAAQVERFELLGQFSAGVAHELNNALAVVEQSSAFIAKNINLSLLRPELADELASLAANGLRPISPAPCRRVRNFAQKHGVSASDAGRILRYGFPKKQQRKVARLVHAFGESILNDCDLAAALHDGAVASQQAAAVVASMRSLGARKHTEPTTFDLTETIDRSLIILRGVLKSIAVTCWKRRSARYQGNQACGCRYGQIYLKMPLTRCMKPAPKNRALTLSSIIAKRITPCTSPTMVPAFPKSCNSKFFSRTFTTKRDGLAFGPWSGSTNGTAYCQRIWGHHFYGDNPEMASAHE